MAQLKDLLVEGKSRFIDKIYASDQFISTVAQGTSPFVISSSTLVSNLNADLVDGQHFNYSNTSNSPTYLWGTSSNGTNYLVSRASMHAGIADKITTVTRSTDAWHYPTFVDSDNSTATEESLYTAGGLRFNPSTRAIAIGTTSTASGSGAIAAGTYATADGTNAVAIGGYVTAIGSGAFARGTFVSAAHGNGISTAFGSNWAWNVNLTGDANVTSYTCTPAADSGMAELLAKFWSTHSGSIKNAFILGGRIYDAALADVTITNMAYSNGTLTFTFSRTLSATAISNKTYYIICCIAGGEGSFVNTGFVGQGGKWSLAGGRFSMALGDYGAISYGHLNIAGGGSSAAFGNHTLTYNNGEFACGSFNNSVSGSTKFSVGIGSADNARKNAFEIISNGNAFLNGVFTINAPAYSANATWTYPGGSYASVASPNIRLIGDPTYGLSTIEFISQKGETSINKPSDCAFIQFQPYGTTTQSAVGSQPTLASSGELNRLVIGVNNDATDTLVLQTPSTTGLKHAVGTGLYTIWDSGNDGSGSGLDADLLDGKHASDFSLAHSHPYLPLAGGTMTGTIYSGSGLVQIWRGSATSGSAGYNTYLAYSGGNIYLATYGSTNTGKTIYLETYDTDLYHRKNLTNYKIWDEGNDGSGSGLDADTVDGIHANSFKTRLTNEKALGQPGWYRILDCTTYSMTFFITFYGGYNYQPPTPATFSVNHSYNTTSITQIGNCPYIGWITKIRAVHYDTYKFYIDIYFNNTSYASNNNAKNNVNFEITPLDVASRSYITLVDYTLITDTVTSNAECATQTTIVPDNAQGANYLNKYNTAVANKLQYACGQFTIGTAAGNAIEGSSASFNLWSYPAGGAYVSSSVANIQTIRLSWDGTHYWHDILASPNYEDLWHRSVINASGKAWRKILDSSNYVSYLGYIGTTPVQASSAAQAVTGITALTFNGATSAGTNYITGTAGRIFFGGNFHLDSLGNNKTYINHYTANHVYIATGGGNVGIGTASPTEKLHVAGNTYISGTLETPGPVRITSTSGEKNILIGNQDSNGANKPAIIKSANATLYFGTGTSWSGTGGTMTTTLFLSGDNKVGIGTTSPENKLDVNGVASIYPRGNDNTVFKGNLIIKQQNSAEDTGQGYTGSKPSFGIQFNRFWTNSSGAYGETSGAGIFATVSSSWRGGLVFRTKDNQTQGGTHDTNALRLRPDGNAVFAGGVGSPGTNGNVTGSYIVYPKGGCYTTNTSSVTGYLKITLPQKGKNTMMSFDVTIYTYDGANQSYTTYHISGYEYSTNGWYEPVTKVYSEGIGPYTNLTVRLGNDGTYACVTIGEANTVWTYPQVTVHNIMTGYSNCDVDTWIGGWAVGFTTTALTTVVATRSSVNTQNINVSGSAGSVAWANITGKPINFKAYSGSLASSGWKTLQGRDSAPSIAIAYNNGAANWNSETYSATMVWGCSDTRGLLDCGYNTPKVTFGGGSYNGTTDDNPKWYFKIKGTSGTEYDFDSRWSLSTHNHNSIYHPLNGKITRSGGSYSWYQFQQYKDASKNSPSYYSADCAIININSYSGWQPWIRGVASDLASWCIGQYTDALHVARIAVTNTTNTTTNRWDFQSNGNFKSANGFVHGNSTYATSAYLLRADGSVTAISSFATSTHTHSFITSAGFSNNGSTSLSTWGTLTTANGYTGILNINDPNGGSWEIAYKDGQQFHQIDGYYYQNEGRYRVTDVTETVTALATSGNYLTWTKNGTTNNITVPYATASNTTNVLNVTGINTETDITESGIRGYSGSGSAWTGSISSMTYAAILTFGNPSRGWQMWARRAADDGMYWRRGNSAATAWEEPRLFLDSSNYTSYTVTKTGGGASGTWAISITGNAATATTASKLGTSNVGAADRPIYLAAGVPTQTTYRMAGTNAAATTALAISSDLDTGIWYVNGTGTSDLYSISDGVAYVNKYSNSWIAEIYQDYRTGQIAVRGKNNGTWQAWRKVFDSVNYTSFLNGTYLRKVTVPNNAANDFNTFESMTLTGRGDPASGASLSNAPWTGAGPAGGYGVLTYLWSGYGTQLAFGYGSNKVYIRYKSYSNSAATWSSTWDSLLLTSEFTTSNITGILPISKGGTGASTAAGARANLGTWSLVSDSYNTLMPADGTTNGWVKIGTSNTSYGILPSASGGAGSGHNYIGTSSWYWKYAYIDDVHFTTLNINNKLVIDSTGRIIPYSTSTRNAGNYGYYDSTLLGHIWSIGTSYSISADGKSPNNLYGLAYFHTNWSNGSNNDGSKTAKGTYAGGHQVAWFNNGVLASSIGDNIYTKGQFISKKAQGTAPFAVDSSTQVTNLKSNFAQYADVLRDPVYYTSGSRRSSGNITFADGGLHYFLATSSMSAANGKPDSDGHILHMAWDNSKWDAQLTLPTSSTGAMQWRVQTNGTDASWTPWKTVIDSSNIGTYAAAANHTHAYIKGSDNRNTNNAPSWYMSNPGSASVYTEFAQSGGAVASTYENRVTFTPWGDQSGQRPVQLAFNNTGMYMRTSSSDSVWNSWNKIALNATLGTTVAMADAGGTITVEANKIIPVTTTNTTTVTFSFAWTGANNCDIAHILITGSGSSKMINIGDMSTGTTKKNVQAILVTSGGFGEISILYANSTYYIRAVGS